MIVGSYAVIEQQLASAVYSYYTRGLAVNVLERYYFEFLVENHQLYLKEQKFEMMQKQFQTELKERKNIKVTGNRIKSQQKTFIKKIGNTPVSKKLNFGV